MKPSNETLGNKKHKSRNKQTTNQPINKQTNPQVKPPVGFQGSCSIHQTTLRPLRRANVEATRTSSICGSTHKQAMNYKESKRSPQQRHFFEHLERFVPNFTYDPDSWVRFITSINRAHRRRLESPNNNRTSTKSRRLLKLPNACRPERPPRRSKCQRAT